MLWNGRKLTLSATLVNARDHGNLTFEVGGQQFNIPHLALIPQRAIDEARVANTVLNIDWLEAQCPRAKSMTLPAEVRSVRDLSNVVVAFGRSAEAREVLLDQDVIHQAAGIGGEARGVRPERGARPERGTG